MTEQIPFGRAMSQGSVDGFSVPVSTCFKVTVDGGGGFDVRLIGKAQVTLATGRVVGSATA